MILIADSGSTKTEWSLMTANGQHTECMTEGINPFFLSVEDMQRVISDQLLPKIAQLLWAGTVTNVFFYGAGCTPEKSPLVREAVLKIFPKATVEVNSDMVGAARGLLQHHPGVACILGTGSNSCYYDGEKIVQNVPSLGFILGDEGSGAALGKRLVADILKNQLSKQLKDKFLAKYQLTQADIIDHVYRQPLPNRFLAQFSHFCSENTDDPQMRQMLYSHFTQFVVRNLHQYYETSDGVERPETKYLPVAFVGSIAYYFRDILRQVMEDQGMVISQIVQTPMKGLLQYHSADLVPTQN